MAADDAEHVAAGIAATAFLLGDDAQVRPVEGALVASRLAHAERADDVERDPPRGRGGQGQDGHVAKLTLQVAQLAIRRSEVVTPVADAVGFVDHDQADAAIGEDAPQRLAQRLGGDVQQLQLTPAQLAEHLAALSVAKGRVEQRRFEAEAFQGIHLVFHERDQRRQHQNGAVE